jgi:drug/metabolite transporter (DMT)-like permease
MSSVELEMSALGPLCAFGSSVTWAVGSSAYSRLSQKYSPFAVNFARALIALPLFILAAFFVSGGWNEGLAHFQSLRLEHWGWFTLSMTASYGLGDTLFLWSTRSLGVPGALAIASCYPLWTVACGYFFTGQTLSWTQGIGIGVTLAGIVTVILNGPKSEEAPKGVSAIGILLALATSVAWATNSFATSRGGADLLAPVGNTIRMIMALILSASFGKFFSPKTAIFLPEKQYLSSLWLFVLEAFLGSYFYMYGLSHTPLTLGTVLVSLAPVISVPVALLLRLEKFSVFRTLGVLMVVFGVWLLLTRGF